MSTMHDTTHEVAEAIERFASRLLDGDIRAGHHLLMIFLPACAWDDSGGSQDIANRLCELLAPYFIPGQSIKENSEPGT